MKQRVLTNPIQTKNLLKIYKSLPDKFKKIVDRFNIEFKLAQEFEPARLSSSIDSSDSAEDKMDFAHSVETEVPTLHLPSEVTRKLSRKNDSEKRRLDWKKFTREDSERVFGNDLTEEEQEAIKSVPPKKRMRVLSDLSREKGEKK